MEKSSNKLVDLSVSFAVEILNLVKYLKEQYYVLRWKVEEAVFCSQLYLQKRDLDSLR